MHLRHPGRLLREVGICGVLLCASCVLWSQATTRRPETVLAGNGVQEQMLWNWNELGAGLDMNVPNTANAKAVDVGGRMVQMHGPSGRLPGYGGGRNFIHDVLNPERLPMNRAQYYRRMRVVPVGHQLHAAPAPATVRTASPQEPGLDAIATAYRRAARLAAEHQQHASPEEARERNAERRAAVQQRLPALRSAFVQHALCGVIGAPAGCQAVSSALQGVVAGTGLQRRALQRRALRGASGAQQQLSRAPAQAPPSAAGGAAVHGAVKAETSALEKAAQSLDSITKSLQAPSARSPRRLSHIAGSLASLSHALQAVPAPAAPLGGRTHPSVAAAEAKKPSAALSRKTQEERIEADIRYHLDKAKLVQALQEARGGAAKKAQGWFGWLKDL